MNYEVYSKIRDSKGLNDYKVSKNTGIGRSTFSDWKNGKSTPKTEKLIKIAGFLNVPVSDFLDIDSKELNEMAEKAALTLDSPYVQLAKRIEALPADKRKALEQYLAFLEQN